MIKNSKIIDGKLHAQNLLKKLKPFGVKYFEKFGRKPSLAVILLGDNPASQIYVKNKIRISRDNNIKSTEILFPNDISENKLLDKIIELNKNNSIDGILVQLPLPKHISEKIIINTIDPEKDVDGFHPKNFGNLLMGNSNLVPCTPLGCIYMLKNELTNLNGKHAVIIGRSNIVGKPMASLLLSSNCTVTVTHSKTKNLDDICKRADILVAAIGRPAMINENYIKENAIVIDVGINRVEYKGINLDTIQILIDKSKPKTITTQLLVENGLANKKDLIKILGRGELKSKINISAHGFSSKAKSIIEDLGGKIEIIEKKKEKVE